MARRARALPREEWRLKAIYVKARDGPDRLDEVYRILLREQRRQLERSEQPIAGKLPAEIEVT